MENVALDRSRIAVCKIITFDPKYRAEFARLNYAWIEKYFAIESEDRKILDRPEEEIIAPGGQIFFAILDERAVGTVALKVETKEQWELTKMGVDAAHRGQGYGQLLLDAAIGYARTAGVKRLVLSSHTSLVPAIAMYRAAGFVERDSCAASCYSRCNIYLQKDL
ncbi:MAG TPA: GNAT family N-acetyltransferase [Steroidobacteraceae bacterium]|nr:GNAT family N-acetyltransferase [Steroidobacteraceae bacterium]